MKVDAGGRLSLPTGAAVGRFDNGMLGHPEDRPVDRVRRRERDQSRHRIRVAVIRWLFWISDVPTVANVAPPSVDLYSPLPGPLTSTVRSAA